MPWLLLLLVLLAFGSTLSSSFHFDDYSLFSDPIVTSPSGWWEVFRLEQTRPLTYLTFWLNYQLGGTEAWGYHAVNLACHLMAVWLAWSVFHRLVGRRAAILATVVFAVHPVQTEPIAYVFGRATLLAALFCLLSWRAWNGGNRWRAVAYFTAALLAKEEAITFPVFLAGYEWMRRRAGPPGGGSEIEWSREWSRMMRPLAAALGIGTLATARLFYAALVTKGAGIGVGLGEITPGTYFLTQGRAVWEYLRLMVWPAGLNFDRDFRLSTGWDAATAAAWIALALLVIAGCWSLRKWPGAFWLLGGLVLLVPTSSIIPLADLVAERRLYLPLLSLSLAIGVILARGPRYTVPVLALLLSGLSFQRSWVWHSEESLWRDTVAKSAAKVRPKIQLARALGAKQPPARDEQLRLLDEARSLAPHDPDVATEIGVVYLRMGRPSDASREFSVALTASPNDPQALTNCGAALYALGRGEEAAETFRTALGIDPCNFDARNNLILAYRKRGDTLAARRTARSPAGCRFTAEQQQMIEAVR